MTGKSTKASRNVVITSGKFPAEARDAAFSGSRPRSDVVELERLYKVPLFEMGENNGKPGALGWTLKMRTAYRALMRIKDYDAAFVPGEEFGIPLVLMAEALRLKRPRFVLRLENLQQGRTHARAVAFDATLRQALKRIDLVLCRNSVNHQLLLGVYGMKPERARVVYDCVDTSFFDPSGPTVALPNFEVPKQPFIVSAGLERRDYPTLIEAVRGLDIRLIIGAASPWSGYRFDGREDLPPNVTVGSFSALQMRALYRAAAFVVVPLQPTLRTCGDSTLTEAWAMSKGVVVTRTAGLLDLISPGINSLAVAPCNVIELRSAVVKLMGDPALCQTLGRAGRAAVLRDHKFEDYVAAIAASLDDVSSRKPLG